MSEGRWLLIETSGRIGQVGLGDSDRVIAERSLDESRRHNRDLAPAIDELLRKRGWTAKALTGVAVSIGPGSYTGLRVGIMTAKTLSFATGCTLAGIPTFEIIARQAADHVRIDVLADALKGKLYVQRFERARAETDLAIVDRPSWLAKWTDDIAVTGPGVDAVADVLPATAVVVEPAQRAPGLAGLLALAIARPPGNAGDDALKLEPIYLRPSSAEEQWTSR